MAKPLDTKGQNDSDVKLGKAWGGKFRLRGRKKRSFGLHRGVRTRGGHQALAGALLAIPGVATARTRAVVGGRQVELTLESGWRRADVLEAVQEVLARRGGDAVAVTILATAVDRRRRRTAVSAPAAESASSSQAGGTRNAVSSPAPIAPAGGVSLASAVGRSGSLLGSAFIERGTALLHQIVAAANDDFLAAALAKGDAMEAVATGMQALVGVPRALTDDEQALAAARARGEAFKVDLLQRAGGSYTAEQLAQVLGKAGGRQTIAEGRKTQRYFGLPLAGGTFAYPKLQVTERGELLPGLQAFLRAFTVPDPWMKLVVLLEPSHRLGGRSPLEALRARDDEGAIAVARAYGSHGA